MKTNLLQALAAALAITGLIYTESAGRAQGAPAATNVPPAAVSSSAPQLAYGVAQVLQLVQAKISDPTIIAYIKNSGNSYGLTADQIIYLRQQGVSADVLNAMLNQPRAGAVAATATPAPQPVASTKHTEPASTATVAPTVTYVQTVPQTVYYYADPYYYEPYYFPPVPLPFAGGPGGGGPGGHGTGGGPGGGGPSGHGPGGGPGGGGPGGGHH